MIFWIRCLSGGLKEGERFKGGGRTRGERYCPTLFDDSQKEFKLIEISRENTTQSAKTGQDWRRSRVRRRCSRELQTTIRTMS